MPRDDGNGLAECDLRFPIVPNNASSHLCGCSGLDARNGEEEERVNKCSIRYGVYLHCVSYKYGRATSYVKHNVIYLAQRLITRRDLATTNQASHILHLPTQPKREQASVHSPRDGPVPCRYRTLHRSHGSFLAAEPDIQELPRSLALLGVSSSAHSTMSIYLYSFLVQARLIDAIENAIPYH